MSLVLNKLHPDDIDEKIRLNAEQGVDIYKLRELIKEEQKDSFWAGLRAQVICQFYTEQLEHIEKRINQIEEKAVESVKG